MRLIVVVNPNARGGIRTAALSALRRALPAAEHTVIESTSRAAAATALTAAIATRPDGVVVVGGDGTVALAVEVLAGSGIPLGVLPNGTGNDFATALGVAQADPAAAAAIIAAGSVREIDLIDVAPGDGSRVRCASVLASGFDSLVNDRANRMRWPRGRRRYDLAILVEYLRLRRLRYQLSWIDEHGQVGTHDGPLLMASVANTRTYGGGIPISPASDPSDGVVELVMVRPAGRLRLLRVLAHVFAATHLGQPEVRVVRVRETRIKGESDVRGYADGDAVGSLPLTVRVLPAALRVFAPAH